MLVFLNQNLTTFKLFDVSIPKSKFNYFGTILC